VDAVQADARAVDFLCVAVNHRCLADEIDGYAREREEESNRKRRSGSSCHSPHGTNGRVLNLSARRNDRCGPVGFAE